VASLRGLRRGLHMTAGGWEAFTQSGYRIISDMSHGSLLLSKEARAAALTATAHVLDTYSMGLERMVQLFQST
jgi:hypothetical protein